MMKISLNAQEHYLEVAVEGRLDATWAESFLDTLRAALRDGQHHIRIDASSLEYLSSAGIRSLLQIHRELLAVNGSFKILQAMPFVTETLSMSGFGQLLEADTAPAQETVEVLASESSVQTSVYEGMTMENLCLSTDAKLTLQQVGGWRPWQPVAAGTCQERAFAEQQFALGIGAPGNEDDGVRERLGEFIAAASCVAYMPGDGFEAPDSLVGAELFVPKLAVLDGLLLEGDFSNLLRFAPQQPAARLTVDGLAKYAMDRLQDNAVGFMMIAEIDGLVGASVARSPGLNDGTQDPASFPEVRDWITFCGERVHSSELALVVGVACNGTDHPLARLLPPTPSTTSELFCHAHAAVFPFRPLPQGRIDAHKWVKKLFEATTPKAILHLLDDDRPLLGLGQSTFVRGACWCSALNDGEDLKV